MPCAGISQKIGNPGDRFKVKFVSSGAIARLYKI